MHICHQGRPTQLDRLPCARARAPSAHLAPRAHSRRPRASALHVLARPPMRACLAMAWRRRSLRWRNIERTETPCRNSDLRRAPKYANVRPKYAPPVAHKSTKIKPKTSSTPIFRGKSGPNCKFGQVWAQLVDIWADLAIGRSFGIGPTLVELGPNLAEMDVVRPKLAIVGPSSIKCGPIWAQSGQLWPKFAPILARVGKILPALGGLAGLGRKRHGTPVWGGIISADFCARKSWRGGRFWARFSLI